MDKPERSSVAASIFIYLNKQAAARLTSFWMESNTSATFRLRRKEASLLTSKSKPIPTLCIQSNFAQWRKA